MTSTCATQAHGSLSASGSVAYKQNLCPDAAAAAAISALRAYCCSLCLDLRCMASQRRSTRITTCKSQRST